jgi:hypothetical protein
MIGEVMLRTPVLMVRTPGDYMKLAWYAEFITHKLNIVNWDKV